MGRPYTDETVVQILERMVEGVTLKKSCEIEGVSYSTVRDRIRAVPQLSTLHAHVRIEYQEYMVARMAEIAKHEPDVQRARLMCDNIKWEACKVAPKIYGDKVTNEHVGPGGGAVITTEMTAQEAAEFYKKNLGD